VHFGGTCSPEELDMFRIGFEDFIYLQSTQNSTDVLMDDEFYASLQIDSIQINV
jgi:hypothetical protein